MPLVPGTDDHREHRKNDEHKRQNDRAQPLEQQEVNDKPAHRRHQPQIEQGAPRTRGDGIEHRCFDIQSGDKQHQPGDANRQRVVGDDADRRAVFFGHHVTQRMHHRGAENRQHPEQFGMVQMQPLAADDHEQAAETDGDAEHLRGVDFLPQKQRGKQQDEHRHAAEQQRRQAGRNVHLAVVEQVIRQAEIRQRDEHKEPAAFPGKQQRFTTDQGEAEKQRKGDQEPQAGSSQRRHAFNGNLDPEPRGAPAQAHDQEQHAGDQGGQPGFGST